MDSHPGPGSKIREQPENKRTFLRVKSPVSWLRHISKGLGMQHVLGDLSRDCG